MKKLLALCLTVMLVVAMVPAVSAADAATISVNNVEAAAGETVDVVVSLANNPGIVSMRIEIAYDASVLEFAGKAPGTAFGGMAYSPDTANPFIANWVDSLKPNNTSNGTFVTLTFKVKEGAKAGKYNVAVAYNADDVYDANFDNVAFETVAGSVTVVCKHTNTTKTAAVAPTCTTAGNTEGETCADCGKVLKEATTIEALGHKEVVVGAKDATCEDAGYTGDKVCEVCDAELAKGEEIAALGHDIVEVAAKEATCTEDGNKAHFACKVCAATYADEDGAEVANDVVIKATGHKYENGVCACGDKEVKEEEKPAEKPADKPAEKPNTDKGDKAPATNDMANIYVVFAMLVAAAATTVVVLKKKA